MGKFTAGPWRYDSDLQGIQSPSGGIAVPVLRGDDTEANARLIAAAPDLLAALEALVASHGGTIGTSDGHPLAVAALTALKKARGE